MSSFSSRPDRGYDELAAEALGEVGMGEEVRPARRSPAEAVVDGLGVGAVGEQEHDNVVLSA